MQDDPLQEILQELALESLRALGYTNEEIYKAWKVYNLRGERPVEDTGLE
jgi:Holliday junction resolvasome RuvABC DNA-binding subunit